MILVVAQEVYCHFVKQLFVVNEIVIGPAGVFLRHHCATNVSLYIHVNSKMATNHVPLGPVAWLIQIHTIVSS